MAVTTNLLLPLLETGQAQKEVTVNSALSYVDDALAGYATKSVAGGADVTLTETEARSFVLRFTGLLTASINVIVPTREQVHIVTNDTTGSFSLTCKPVAGTGVAITQGTKAIIYCDGTNVVAGPGGTGSGVTDGDKGDITVSSSGTVWTVDNNTISDAKLRDSGALSVIGRSANSSGDPADISGTASTKQLLRISGTTLGFGTVDATYVSDFDEAAQDAVGGILTDSSRIDFTYTDGGPSITADLIADSVDNTFLANMAQSTIKGRAAGAGTGDPTDLTATQATAILDNMVGDSGSGGTKGLVPAPAAGDAAASKFLKADGTWATAGGVSGGAANKIAYWTGATTLSNDTSLSWDATNDILGLIATTAGTSGQGVFSMGLGTAPTTGITDGVQLYAVDEAATQTGLAIRPEGNSPTLISKQMVVGSLSRSASVTVGLVLDQAGNNDGILEFRKTGGNVAHGMTSIVATDIYADFRVVSSSEGGLQSRALTETTIAHIISALHTTETTTKSANADAPVIIEVATKSGTTVTGLGAAANMFAIQDRFAANPTKFIVDQAGSTWQPSYAQMQHLWITDGMAAPSATTGVAKIYVDTSDGDLKVIFADGTIKTIVTDT